MSLDHLVASVAETLKSKFPEHGTLVDLQLAASSAVDNALGQFDSPIEFFVRHPEALEDQLFIDEDQFPARASTGERIDQLAALSLMKRLAPTKRELLLGSFADGLHAAAWDFLDVAVRCAGISKLGLLDKEDVKDTRILFTCDGKVGEWFSAIASSVNRMMAQCLDPEEMQVDALWSKEIAKSIGGFDKAREIFEITKKFDELDRTYPDQFRNAVERAAKFEPTRSFA